MANTPKELPRVVQSDLHDVADDIGERIARGQMIEIATDKQLSGSDLVLTCTCHRFCAKGSGKAVVYWDEPDPNCKYVHLAPPRTTPYTVPL